MFSRDVTEVHYLHSAEVILSAVYSDQEPHGWFCPLLDESN